MLFSKRQRMRPCRRFLFKKQQGEIGVKISPQSGIDYNPRNTGDGNPCLFNGWQQQNEQID